MTIECDVLVVGAGPAGCVASLLLSKNNKKVVTLEKNSEVGAHTNTKIDITPQENLDEILKKLKLKYSGYGKKSTWYSPNGEKYIMESEIGEYYFKRGSDLDSFEKQTIKQAQESGCKLICGSTIKDISTEGKIINIILKNGEHIETKYIIGCDGKNSIVVDECFKKQDGKELIGYGISGYDFDIIPGTSEIFFDANLIPGGYIFLAKDDNGLSTAGIVLDPKKTTGTPEKYLNSYLEKNKYIKEKLKGKVITKFQGTGYIGALENIRKENILLAGDAGRLASPFFGYGMRSAIISGYLAGEAVNDVLDGNFEKLNNYDSNCKEKINLKILTELGKKWENLDNEDLNIFFEVLRKIDEMGEKIGFLEKIKILKMLRKSKRSRQLRHILTLFKEMA